VWIHKIVNYWPEIKEGFCSVTAAETSHGFESVVEFLVVSFDWIVVMFESCSFGSYRYAKHEFGNVEKKFVECSFVWLKFVAYKNDSFMLVILTEYLLVTRVFYLSQKDYAVV
jgi:hypothetical protein